LDRKRCVLKEETIRRSRASGIFWGETRFSPKGRIGLSEKTHTLFWRGRLGRGCTVQGTKKGGKKYLNTRRGKRIAPGMLKIRGEGGGL